MDVILINWFFDFLSNIQGVAGITLVIMCIIIFPMTILVMIDKGNKVLTLHNKDDHPIILSIFKIYIMIILVNIMLITLAPSNKTIRLFNEMQNTEVIK